MNSNSSNSWIKAAVFFILAAVVLVGGWYGWNMKMAADEQRDLAAQAALVGKEQPVTQGGVQVSAASQTESTTNTDSTDTSNEALDKDAADVDAQMSNLNNDNAKVDASFSDQQVPIAQ